MECNTSGGKYNTIDAFPSYKNNQIDYSGTNCKNYNKRKYLLNTCITLFQPQSDGSLQEKKEDGKRPVLLI